MPLRSCIYRWLLSVVSLGPAVTLSAHAPAEPAQNKKPSISLKANPPVGFTPLRVVLTAEVKGGANDFEDFYCADVEWDWGDDTKSESKADCDPYEPGKSEIKRRYVQEHTYRATTLSGSVGGGIDASGVERGVQYRVRFLLKQKNKTVGSGQTVVEVRPGGGGH